MTEAPTTDPRPVVYDLTRLVTRITTDTPNGIDRVDLALAKHFAFRPAEKMHGLLETFAGPRLVPAAVARAIVRGTETWWQEIDQKIDQETDHGIGGVHDAGLYEQVVARLVNPDSGKGRIARPARDRSRAALAAIWNYALRLGQAPAGAAPHRAAYINASNFPLEYAWHLRWLRERPDIAPESADVAGIFQER